MANDLNRLNEVLFETLDGVKTGKIDEKKAQTIVNIGNSIVNNAKIQLAAFKMTKGKTGIPLLAANADNKMTYIEGNDRSAMEEEYALQYGYKNVAEAVVTMGKDKFKNAVDEFIKATEIG